MRIARRRQRGSVIAEFGPVLWMFFVLFLLPFIDLLSFATGVGCTMFMANMAAHNCASASTFADAQAAVAATENQLGNFRAFAKMSPASGALSGINLCVVVAPMNGNPQTFTAPGAIPNNEPTADPSNPNDPANPQPNTGNAVYSWFVTASYNVSPIFNFNSIGWLKGVPAVGSPVPVTFTASATVEHPDGLNSGAVSAGGLGSSTFSSSQSATPMGGVQGGPGGLNGNNPPPSH